MYHGGSGIPMIEDEGIERAKGKPPIDFATGKPLDCARSLDRLLNVFSNIFNLAKAEKLPNSSQKVDFPSNHKTAEMVADVQLQFSTFLKENRGKLNSRQLFETTPYSDEDVQLLLNEAATPSPKTDKQATFDRIVEEAGLSTQESQKCLAQFNASSVTTSDAEIEQLLNEGLSDSKPYTPRPESPDFQEASPRL